MNKLGYVWKGVADAPQVDGEYSFYPTVEKAKEVFNKLIASESEINAYTYGVAEFDETADSCLTPMEVIGFWNI